MTRGIEALEVSVYRIPLDAPESDGTLRWDDTTVVLVDAAADGAHGLGFTYATPASARLIRDVLGPVVCGRDAEDPPLAWQAMVIAIRNLGRPGLVSSAIAAVDIALWDLKAHLANTPLCRLLGMSRPAIPIYGSGGFTSLSDDELAVQLSEWVDGQAIPRVKMKIGTDWGCNPARDVERVRLARVVIGPDAELFVDANGAYEQKQALRLAHVFGDFGVTWFEEPVSSDDLAGLREIRSDTDIEVAAGEYGYALPYFAQMCDAQAVDCLQADVTRCAGITEWLRVAALAAAHGLELSGHCASSLHVHPACTIPNLRHLEYFADHARADRLLFDGVVEPEPGGFLRPDLSRPGLGLTLQKGDAERFRVDA
jgi:L-alanine-DL-glutamate epimerase-like enolase superfamily enzyme